MKHCLSLITLVFVMFTGVLSVVAQEDAVSPPDLLVTALDENGVEQVYRIDVSSGEVEQVSDAEFSVEAFDLTENVLAYVSGGVLHIEYSSGEITQPLHRPQELLVTVHISPDEQEVSYNDETGLYILNIDSSEAQVLLEHKDFMDPDNPNGVGDGRYYYEAKFLENSDDLMIEVGLWESRHVGFYDRSTKNLTEYLADWTAPEILYLEDGRVLLHNYDGRGCNPCGLWIASSIDDSLSYDQLVDENDLSMGESDVLLLPIILTMTERADGVVRLLVKYGVLQQDRTVQHKAVLADLDLETDTITPIMDPFTEDVTQFEPQLSPDGSYLAVIKSPASETYAAYGDLLIYDVESGVPLPLDVPLEVSSIRWAE